MGGSHCVDVYALVLTILIMSCIVVSAVYSVYQQHCACICVCVCVCAFAFAFIPFGLVDYKNVS